MKRVVLGVLVGAVALVLAAVGVVAAAVVTAHPDHTGEVTLAALAGDAEVRRDGDGAVFAVADGAEDLFRAQGFAHAQDRFWQMDVNRHVAAGRMAELVGDAALPADRFIRTLGWQRVAEAEVEALSDEAVAVLDAYAEGVNAHLATQRTDQLGVAYRLLEPLDPQTPQPWEPAHSLALLKLMAWDLRSNLITEIERAVLAGELDAERLAELYPPARDTVPVIVPGFEADDVDGTDPEFAGLGHPDVAAGAARLATAVAAVEGVTGGGGEAMGSNAWVVAGEHTASGAPLLANDPHLPLSIPSVWYENHLRCRSRDSECPYDVAGVSLPGLPGVLIGHNDRIAWGLTNMGADVTDLYVERVHPQDPDRVEVEGEWQQVDVRTETLRSADGTTEDIEVRTTRNGPIVSDAYEPLDDVDPSAQPDVAAEDGDDERYELSLRWTALEPSPTFEAVPAVNAARDLEEFREAASRFAVPAQNMVYADADGTIAYQAPGWLPIRRAHDGALPAPGWDDDYQWDGYVPFEDLPFEANPERGWIATANERVVDADAYDFPLSVDWDHGYRKRRIVRMLEERLGDYTVADAAADQLDTFDPSGARGVPYAVGVAADDRRVAAIQSLLRDWDLRAEADSAGAAAWMATWRHMLAATFHSELPEAAWPRRHDRLIDVMARLYEDPDSDWWDDPATDEREGRDDIMRLAMARAHDELADQLGDNRSRWRWGDAHAATFRESTLGDSGIAPVEALVNRGGWAVGGSSAIVNATGWDAVEGYEAVTGPVLRTVVDLADLDHTHRLHPPGQSGHPFHAHYTNLADDWAEGRLRTRPFTPEAVADAADDRLVLRAD